MDNTSYKRFDTNHVSHPYNKRWCVKCATIMVIATQSWFSSFKLANVLLDVREGNYNIGNNLQTVEATITTVVNVLAIFSATLCLIAISEDDECNLRKRKYMLPYVLAKISHIGWMFAVLILNAVYATPEKRGIIINTLALHAHVVYVIVTVKYYVNCGTIPPKEDCK